MLLKEIDPRLRRMIIQAVRKWFVMTPKYQEVRKKARRETPTYKKDGTLSKKKAVDYRCASCREYYKSNEIEVDHIQKVVPRFSASSVMTLNHYIKQVDCPMHNLQVLCKKCHKEKTAREK